MMRLALLPRLAHACTPDEGVKAPAGGDGVPAETGEAGDSGDGRDDGGDSGDGGEDGPRQARSLANVGARICMSEADDQGARQAQQADGSFVGCRVDAECADTAFPGCRHVSAASNSALGLPRCVAP